MKDIDQIRRDNLRQLQIELGGPAETANAIGMSLSQFTNLRDGAKDSKTGKPRGMRKETARKIDAAVGKYLGWLDTDHRANPAPIQAPPAKAWAAYLAASVNTRAAVDLLLLPKRERDLILARNTVLVGGVALLEENAQRALAARKIA